MRGLPTASEKPRFVAAMFGRIARRYDLMNTLMTLGQDEAWRRAVARSVGTPTRVLDVGTGTARLARALAAAHPVATVVGVDFSEPMLRASAKPRTTPLAAADALMLPFRDNSFDAVTSAFLVRNLADVRAGIAEQARVLRSGGSLVVLDTTPGPRNWLRPLARLYLDRVVPLLGKLLAGDAAAYTYLPASSAAFLDPEDLAQVIRTHGLQDPTVRRLALGCVAVVSAHKSAELA
jgi:demethylmenaquinone methyltransferase / 2-methoxy-6-polyprenyl-1,4-benzoquinol methylase